MNKNIVRHASKTVHLSELNKRRVIDVLLTTDACSRRELARRTHLANSTISTITSELMEAGLIHRVGKRNQRMAGRREELIGRNQRAASAIAVHYTTDALAFGLVDFGLNVLEEFHAGSLPVDGQGIDRIIVDRVQELLRRDGRSRPSVVALSLPNYPIREAVLTNRVADALDIPVVGLNNVASMAVYNNYLFAHDGPGTFSLVYVGTGIGSAFVIGNEVYHGVNGNASDLGHVHIKDSPVICRCGRTGCLETFASLHALSRAVQQHYGDEYAFRGDELVRFLHECLLLEDRFVRELLDQACADLAKGIRNLAAVLDPGTVLVVSRLNRLNPFIEERLRAHFYTGSGLPTVHTTTLEFGKYRPEAGIMGAGLFGFRQLLGGAQPI